MGSLVKGIAIVLSLVLVVLVGAITYVLVALDPNDYKPEIEKAAADAGVSLQINGDLGWRIFPGLGIRIEGIEFTADGASGELQQAELAVALLPLLRGSVAIDSLAIEGADLVISSPEGAAGVAASSGAEGSTKSADGSAVNISIDHFTVANSKLTYQPAEGDPVVVTNLKVETHYVALDDHLFPIEISFDTQIGEHTINLALDGQAAIDEAMTTFSLANMEVKGHLESAGYGYHDFTAITTARLDIENGGYSFDRLDITLDDIEMSATASATADGTKGQFEIKPFDLSKELRSFYIDPPTTRNPDAFTKVAAASSFTLNADGSFALPDMTVALDEAQLALAVALNQVGSEAAPKQNLSLKLMADAFDATGYMPPASEKETSSSDEAAALLSPLAALTTLVEGKSQLNIDIKKLILDTMELSNLLADVETSPNRIDLKKVSTGIFGGTADANGIITLSGAAPTLNISKRVANIDLAQAAEVEGLTGLLNLDFTGISSGDTLDELIAAMDGSGKVGMSNLGYTQFSIEKAYCEMAALVEQKNLAGSGIEFPPGTRFDDMQGGFTIKNNKFQMDQLNTGTGNIRLRANVIANMGDQTYSLRAGAKLAGEKTSETGCVVSSTRLRNTEVPLKCEGNYGLEGGVSCGADKRFIEEFIKGAVTDKLKDKLLDKFGSKPADGETTEGEPATEDPVNSLIKGIFGGKKQEDTSN